MLLLIIEKYVECEKVMNAMSADKPWHAYILRDAKVQKNVAFAICRYLKMVNK